MALTQDSVTEAVQRKAKRAHRKVKAAEADLMVANDALKEALPRNDGEAIAEAAQLTVAAEEEVREAAQELEVVNELLEGSPPAPSGGTASGEGLKSLLPWLKRRD